MNDPPASGKDAAESEASGAADGAGARGARIAKGAAAGEASGAAGGAGARGSRIA